MSKEQKANAEPFPNCPPAPDTPNAPKAKWVKDVPSPAPDAPNTIWVKDIPPPPPMSMEKLAEEGAIFYYEDKKISSIEAINIFNANKELNVEVKDYGSEQPVVKISKKPFKLKKNSKI
jgi:hypothetical protein